MTITRHMLPGKLLKFALPVLLALLSTASATLAELHLFGSVEGIKLEVTGNDGKKPVYTNKDTGKPGYFAENTRWQLVAEGGDISDYLLVPPRYMLYREPDNLDDINDLESRIYSVKLRIGKSGNDSEVYLDYTELIQFWPADILENSIITLAWMTPEKPVWNSSILILERIPREGDIEANFGSGELTVHGATKPGAGIPVIAVVKEGVFQKPDLSAYPLSLDADYQGTGPMLNLDTGFSFVSTGNHGDSLLHIAANHGMPGAVKSILKQDNSAGDRLNQLGESPLMSAALGGHREIFDHLVNQADVSTFLLTKNKKAILDYILYTGHTELLQELQYPYWKYMRSWIDTTEDKEDTYLHLFEMCMAYRRDDCIFTLYQPENIKEAPDPEFGNPKLFQACRRGMSNTASYILLKYKADPNVKIDGHYALATGASSGSARLARTLIDSGANMNQQDDAGNTALIVAAYLGNDDYLKALVEAGANVNLLNNASMSALQYAIYEKHSDISIFLLENGADPNALNNQGESPLWLASTMGDRQSVQQLLSKGAICNLSEELALDLMEYAFRWDIPEVVDIALGQCLDPDFYFHDSFPAQWVANWYKAEEVAGLLQERGASQMQPKLVMANTASLDEVPKVVQASLPDYPRELQIKYQSVEIHVDVIIAPDGSVLFPKVTGLEIPELRRTFYNLIGQWKFTEPRSNGNPVFIKSRIPVFLKTSPDNDAGAFESKSVDTPPIAIKTPKIKVPVHITEGVNFRVKLDFVVTSEGIPVQIKVLEFREMEYVQTFWRQDTAKRIVDHANQRIIRLITKSVSGWRFEPGKKNGKPVDTHIQMPDTIILVTPFDDFDLRSFRGDN